MVDICIIGAGVVGGMIAERLSRYNLSIVIVDKGGDVALGATRANSAIVHAGFDAKEGTLKARLNVRGSQMMEETCKRLGVKYKRNGSLVIGFNELNVVVMDPEKGEVYKIGMNDATERFEKSGNCFITYTKINSKLIKDLETI